MFASQSAWKVLRTVTESIHPMNLRCVHRMGVSETYSHKRPALSWTHLSHGETQGRIAHLCLGQNRTDWCQGV